MLSMSSLPKPQIKVPEEVFRLIAASAPSNKSSYSEHYPPSYPPLFQLASQMVRFNSGEHGLGFPHIPVTNPHRIALYTDVFSTLVTF
jgi:hypothetical protein